MEIYLDAPALRNTTFFFFFFQILLVAAAMLVVNCEDTNDTFLNIPGEQIFTDRSAPADTSNLQSTQYQDFIRNLYRFDKENLQKYDNLFQNAPPTAAP